MGRTGIEVTVDRIKALARVGLVEEVLSDVMQ